MIEEMELMLASSAGRGTSHSMAQQRAVCAAFKSEIAAAIGEFLQGSKNKKLQNAAMQFAFTRLFHKVFSPMSSGFVIAGFGEKEIFPAIIAHVYPSSALLSHFHPDDATQIWGYYTLSAAILVKTNLSGSDEKRVSKKFMGYPAPMVRVGFMGRDDTAVKGFGAVLIVDAARRVYRNQDIGAWGLVLESEGGEAANPKLWAWYLAQGFKPCRTGPQPNSMYGPLSAFLPELQG